MSIDYLKAVISPPQNVVDRPSEGDWAGVEARLGTVLPDDYKDFCGNMVRGVLVSSCGYLILFQRMKI